MRMTFGLAAGAIGAAVLLPIFRPTGPVGAGTALRLGVPELVQRADLVLEARVAAARGLESSSGRIETEYVLHVERTFLGEPSGVRAIRLPGGVLEDGRGLVLPGLPRLAVGEEVLLFLTAPSSCGWRMPVGLAQGKLRIATAADGRRLLVSDDGPLTLADGASGALRDGAGASVRDYAEVVAEIHAALIERSAAGNGGWAPR